MLLQWQHMCDYASHTLKTRIEELASCYHIHHPFNVKMNSGELNKEQIQAWVINRFYYQLNIPLKDAAILAKCPVLEIRRRWIKRIEEQDGQDGTYSGIESWLTLGKACGIDPEMMWSQEEVLPGVRFAVDAYRNFVQQASWQEGVAASLSELFAARIHQQRLESWPFHYPWVDRQGLQYFENRLHAVGQDLEFALNIVQEYFATPPQQERMLKIIRFKLAVLWSILDSLYLANIAAMPPPSQLRVNL